MGKHIAIAGNIGVGKSTLTELLSERIGAAAYYESVEDHPYLELFYEDMHRWAFHSQFYFLTQAFRQHCEIARSDRPSIQDRTIYEHMGVFASSLHRQGILSMDDLHTLESHYDALEELLPSPDLMIYLRGSVPVLTQRIAHRSRDCEASVDPAYLAALGQHYEDWIGTYDRSDVLIVDTDTIDIHDLSQREQLLTLIADRIGAPAAALSA